MILKKLLSGVRYKVLSGNVDIDVKDVCTDTRNMTYKSVFVCTSGTNTDTHKMVKQAIYKGAVAIVCEKDVDVTEGITVILVNNTRYALALMAATFYGRPSDKMTMIGITGTKGKTTVSYMIKSILTRANIPTGLIGSIETSYDDVTEANNNTTPEPLRLQRILSDMYKSGIKAVVMEVSSQGLKMNRVDGIIYDYAVFTNFSRDHIGSTEHKDMDEYLMCKAKLFTMCRHGIFNADDECTQKIIDISKINNVSFFSTGKFVYDNYKTDVVAENINEVISDDKFGIMFGMRISHDSNKIRSHTCVLSLPGLFSVYNALAAASVCDIIFSKCDEEYDLSIYTEALCDIKVDGRLQVVRTKAGAIVVIDYAHNEISLRGIINTMRVYAHGRIITLFGCGGDRSKERRYSMGKAAAELSDMIIVTSDNPRNENPNDIMKDIEMGINLVEAPDYIMISDRKEAIHYALSFAAPGDIVIVAGKGHENYQEIKGSRYYMKDADIVRYYTDMEENRING
ncbi:MAG: UDP-N-acetylmuramoyl-L-alanyl-D-glutamate--2,6-diaminopimelate ligase [Lachnospiraceae bacterium]|nr:UDP-N-acetylmuramoyl-L-alanyl-D-glutamate--2,6-diaminopimelate ligase [Lachnospiraceae bacterium]